jgi:uncharacterized membrane protein
MTDVSVSAETAHTPNTPFSIKTAFVVAWAAFQSHLPIFLLIGLVQKLFQITPQLVVQFKIISDSNTLSGLSLVLLGVSLVFTMGWIALSIRAARGEKVELQQFLPKITTAITFLVTSVLLGIMVSVGFLLLVFPGLYLTTKYGFVPFLIIDQNMSRREAFRLSSEMTKGIKIQLLGFYLLMGIIDVLGMLLPYGLGLLITMPLTTIAHAHIYHTQLVKVRPPAPPAPTVYPAL